jgi:hypothetical protein
LTVLAPADAAWALASITATVPGGFVEGHGVDQDERVVPTVEQVVGQVHPADAVVGDVDTLRHLTRVDPAYDLDAEAVVPEEDVADPGHQHPRGAGRGATHGAGSSAPSGSTSSGAK